MTEEKTFEPITSQEQLDAIISKRVKDEKGLREEVENLKAELQAKDTEATRLQKEHALESELQKRSLHTDLVQGKAEAIRKLTDVEDETPIAEQLQALERAVPDLFRVPVGAGSGGSSKPVLDKQERPLTEEDVSKMTPEEMARPGVMERVDRFVKGERG